MELPTTQENEEEEAAHAQPSPTHPFRNFGTVLVTAAQLTLSEQAQQQLLVFIPCQSMQQILTGKLQLCTRKPSPSKKLLGVQKKHFTGTVSFTSSFRLNKGLPRSKVSSHTGKPLM